MIIRYAEEKNFIELRQFYDGMCKVLSGKDFLPEGDKGGFPPDEMIKDAIKERNQFIGSLLCRTSYWRSLWFGMAGRKSGRTMPYHKTQHPI